MTSVLFLSVSILVLKLINNSLIVHKVNLVWISDLNKHTFLRFYVGVKLQIDCLLVLESVDISNLKTVSFRASL